MFASMFKSLFNKSGKNVKKKPTTVESQLVETTKKDFEDMLISLNEIDVDIKEILDNSVSCSVSLDNIIDGIEAIEPITDTHQEYFNDSASVDNFDDTKSEVSSVGENQLAFEIVENVDKNNTADKINNFQCLFTWNIKPNNKKNIILSIQNKYGDYNLDLSSSEFTFERYVGNLIIGYELFHKGESELGQMKILEIGKWLEELDNGTDEFYLSINVGIQHVMKATFIHMLFATNLTGECKWLLDDIIPLAYMDSKSKATVHAVRAAVFTEYGGSPHVFKRACSSAKRACDLDPNTSQWFYIYSLALTTQRQFLQSHKSTPTDNEKNAVQKAIMLSDGNNTIFNYHRMILDRDTAIQYYHDNKNNHDKFWIEKNRQANEMIVKMIKTIISMEPKDPLLVVKCARTIMTLPIMVRDLNLGKQYLTKAYEMAPNDATVLKAIEKTVEVYKDISKKQRTRTTETKNNYPASKNRKPKLGSDLGFIVKKQKNGEDPIPYLTDLISKYNGLDKSKIIAQLCSYIILFTNNLRSGVEEFIKLIEIPGMANNYIITQHFSSFGSKKFHLAELICNEIRLATNSSSTAPDDMLYFFKMLTKIMETCNLQMKDVDSSLKAKLIIDSSAKSLLPNNTPYESGTGSSDNESDVEKVFVKRSTRRCKFKQNIDPKVFFKMPEANKGSNGRKDKSSGNHFPSRNYQNKNHPANTTAAIDEMNFKMAKFLNISSGQESRYFENSNILTTENLRNVQTQSQVEEYTHQLYQHISANNNTHQHQINIPGTSTGYYGRYNTGNPAFPNVSSMSEYSQFNNQLPPSLLSIRPQINQQNPKPRSDKSRQNKWTTKNK
ncbi:uncharacterized protein LOC113549459 [Rhopalosiphum maidis]|uniref:uncharacterized protein LOC113549459 n=1 Tax=Rhopalosiphum maidis TaxID=43146 RepID=UPI000EFF6A10|nr:uncharacterized protein LOC113549459 [Rhopalosiphum maidis]XP_026806571.1 uncharacterized protein LOC113549459 [Rhopalosiphum maidis]XP_026806572.1 uncharacterized protein LOC113549459 [Rhopalosiphum maidis]XP_026806573.1 uncharacterized protein LOC113549459 [Rhopalosiphum maidis]